MTEPRVLIVHNRYRQPGGEERLVGLMRSLLSERGIECRVLERESLGLGRARAGVAMLKGGLAPGEVAAAVREMRANVVHVHNIHPLFGLRALKAARAAGARTVMHLHNFRLFCAIGICHRDGRACFDCQGRRSWPGIRHNCRGSAAESATYGAALALHQTALLRAVDAFVAPSDFLRCQLERMGLPPGRCTLLRNFLPDEELAAASAADRGSFALFAGRLAEEKGLDVAIRAAARAGVPLKVAGTGPDAERCRALAASSAGIELLGPLAAEDLHKLRAQAAFAVLPSRWPEVCPFAAIEAMAAGLPTFVARTGGLPELVGPEQAITPGAADAWARTMRRLWESPAERKALGEANLERARRELSADVFFEGLVGVYERLVSGQS